jgi:hypothetical protein
MTVADWIVVFILGAILGALCWLDAEVKHRRRARRSTARLPGVPSSPRRPPQPNERNRWRTK